MNNLNLHLRGLEKKEQVKPKISRGKEINEIKIRKISRKDQQN